MAETSNDERTETATAYRREEFRRQGTVAMSRELLSIALFVGVGLTLYFAVNTIFAEFGHLSDSYFRFSRVTEFGKPQMIELKAQMFKSWGWMVLPVFLSAIVMGILACAAQVGFYVTWEPLSPKWERLNPVNGFQRLFSAQASVEAIKAVLKMSIAGFIVWNYLKARALEVGNLFQKTVFEITVLLLSSIGKLFTHLILFLGIVAILDYFFQRFQLEKQMKMTRREAKEEFKLREGDPLIKSRIRSIQRRIASRRMMESVPKATVIVTNPTHLAIALQYDAGEMIAPKVTAKGAGHIAEKIKEIARFHHIPIVENKPLARTMFKTLNIGQNIPRELYKAVAEVLSYVYRLKVAIPGVRAA